MSWLSVCDPTDQEALKKSIWKLRIGTITGLLYWYIYSILFLFSRLEHNEITHPTLKPHIPLIHNKSPDIILLLAAWDSSRKCLELYNPFVIWHSLRTTNASCQGSSAAQLSREKVSVKAEHSGRTRQSDNWCLNRETFDGVTASGNIHSGRDETAIKTVKIQDYSL